MDQPETEKQTAEDLRRVGARFAFVHGSRARGPARPGSDLDVAAWWGGDAPAPWEVELPALVDLLVLEELADFDAYVTAVTVWMEEART